VSRCPEKRGKQSQSGSRNGPLAVKQPGLVYILPAEVEASDESSKIDKYVENCVAGVHGKLIHCCVANQTTFIGESDNGRSPQVAIFVGYNFKTVIAEYANGRNFGWIIRCRHFDGHGHGQESPGLATTAGRTEARRYERSTLYAGLAVLGCLNLKHWLVAMFQAEFWDPLAHSLFRDIQLVNIITDFLKNGNQVLWRMHVTK
jgi:hypothetical protein